VAPQQDDGGERSLDRIAVDIAVRLGFLGLFAWFALTLMRPFLPILLWSIVLTVAFYPAFAWLKGQFGGRAWLASTCLTGFALGIVLGPTTILIASLIRSLEFVAHHLGAGRPDLPPPPKALTDLPVIGDDLTTAWTLASSNVEEFMGRYGKALLGAGEWLLHFVAGLAGSIVVILLAVLISGFLYAHGPRLVEGFRLFAQRVIGERGSGFVDLAGVTIRNVARGVIGVAIIQGLLTGFGLIVAEVPGAGLLTLAVVVLAILQIGGAPVMLPVLIWAWLNMETMPALFLTLYLIPVTLIDNVLKPILMGKGLTTPMLVILIGVIGGTISYGLIGLFLGPIVLAVFYELLIFWVASGPPAAGRGGIE
jgi:predicted PurR-regulated permease PerM